MKENNAFIAGVELENRKLNKPEPGNQQPPSPQLDNSSREMRQRKSQIERIEALENKNALIEHTREVQFPNKNQNLDASPENAITKPNIHDLFESKDCRRPLLEEYKLTENENLDEIRFKPLVYLEFFVYHFLFFFTLGPIGAIILLIFGNKYVIQNQQFVGVSSIIQTVQWGLLLSAAILYICGYSGLYEMKYIYPIEIIGVFYILLIRISFIACKYAYSTPRYLKTFRASLIPFKSLSSQLLLHSLFAAREQEDVNEQVQESIVRLKIDPDLFYFTFMGHDPDLKSQKSSTKNYSGNTAGEQKRNKVSTEIITHHPQNLESNSQVLKKEMLSGYSLCTEMIFKFKAHLGVSIAVAVFSGIVTVGRALVPLIIRLINQEPAVGVGAMENYMIIAILLCTSYFYFANTCLTAISIVDLNFKLALLSEANNLLPETQETGKDRQTPPLNIFNPISLRSWETFRDVFISYGSKYHARHNLNLNVMFFIYLVQLVGVVLQVLKLVKFNMSIPTGTVLLYESLVILVLLFIVLAQGSRLNNHFGKQRTQMQRINRVFSDMLNMKEYYFKDKSIKSTNQLVQEGINYFNKIFKVEETYYQNCVSRLQLLEKISSEIFVSLDIKARENAFEIFGVKINWHILKAGGVLVVSVAVAISQVHSDV